MRRNPRTDPRTACARCERRVAITPATAATGSWPTFRGVRVRRPSVLPTPRPTAPHAAPDADAPPVGSDRSRSCDSITVSGTETSAMYWGSYDGLYEKAGECNGQPYYKCTCCTDYDPDVVEMCAADPEGCADENGRAWDQSQCMADIGGGGVHHYVYYSSDDAAWYLKQYWGDGSGTDDGWDECGTVGDFGRGNEYRLEPWWGSLAGSAGRLWARTSTRGRPTRGRRGPTCRSTSLARPMANRRAAASRVCVHRQAGGHDKVVRRLRLVRGHRRRHRCGRRRRRRHLLVGLGLRLSPTDGMPTTPVLLRASTPVRPTCSATGGHRWDTIVVGAMNEGPGWVDGTYYQVMARSTSSDDRRMDHAHGDQANCRRRRGGRQVGRSVAIDGNTIGRSHGGKPLRLPPHGHGGFTVVKAKSGTKCGEGDAVGRKVLAPSALAGTRCCGSIYDSFCNNDNDRCLNGAAPGYVTYEVAKATCEDAGARLCTPDELNLHHSEGGVMGTGCNFDRAYAWSSEVGAGYIQVAKLKSSDAAEEDSWGRSAALGDRFGHSVAVADGTVVVGVPGDDVVKDKYERLGRWIGLRLPYDR